MRCQKTTCDLVAPMGRMGGAWYGDGGGGPRLPTGGRRADHAAARMAALPRAGCRAGRRRGHCRPANERRRPGRGGRAGRGSEAPPSAPPGRGRGGAESPPTGGVRADLNHVPSAATTACLRFRRSPTPPPNLMGGVGEHRRLSPRESARRMDRAQGTADLAWGMPRPGGLGRTRPERSGPPRPAACPMLERGWADGQGEDAPPADALTRPTKSARVSVSLPTAGPPQ